MSSQAQITANRANSQLSTGPKTAEGKCRVSHNAVKTALTGATVLLPTDDAVLYEEHISETIARWKPETHHEKLLVQSIADTEWRLRRIPALISATLALARLRNTEFFEDHPEHLRALLIEGHIEELCGRQLRNLRLQESRLRRYRERDIAELEALQAKRQKQREEQLEAAARLYERWEANKLTFNPSEFGFEFSLAEIEEKVLTLWAPQLKKKAA